MAPQGVSRRRQRAVESNSEEEVSGTEEGSPPAQGSEGNKRPRLDDEIASSSSSPRSPLLPNGYLADPSSATPNGTSYDLGSYQPGSIVRVKLINFVTYTSAEFFPGPSLNMVIGPNGTGKSTLVCAICLGLGWGPQHLGRAKDVGEFVKHGCREATIEIELAADPQRQRQNPVIQRTIKREGNKSNFFIDERSVPQKGVLELARSYSIQIDNLCQFLPQDKVVEFAALTPVELLNSTQRAAAPEEMIKWHEELKELRAQQKQLQSRQASDKEALAGMESRQETQRADVERMNEREELERRVNLLEKARPFPAYREARLRWNESKQKKKDAQADLKLLEDAVQPALRAVNAKQAYRDQVERATKERRRLVESVESAAEDRMKKVNNIEEQMDDIKREVDAEVKQNKTRRLDKARHEGNVTRLKTQQREHPIEFDVAAFNEQIREKTRSMRDIETQLGDMASNYRTNERQYQDREQRIQQGKKELQDLDSQAGQQARILQRMSRDTFQAWNWIQEHQDQFEKHVFGPAIIECSIKDRRYANQIESLFQRNDLISFTCQTPEDFKKLQDVCYKHLKLSEINIRTSRGRLDRFRPPCPEQEMKRLGFVGWAIDFITGPEAILSLLCSENHFHATGVLDTIIDEEHYARLERSGMGRWVDRKSTYRLNRRREYGPNAVSTQVRDVRPARVWANQSVDTGLKGDIERKIHEAEQERDELRKEMDSIKETMRSKREKLAELKKEKEKLEQEKNDKQKALAEFRAIPNRIKQQQEKIAMLDAATAAYQESMQTLHDKWNGLALRKGHLALQYAEIVRILQDRHNDLLEAEVILIEAKSDYDTLCARNQEVKNNLEERRREVDRISKEAEVVNKQAKSLLLQCQQIMTDANEEEEAFFSSCTKSSEEHEAEIESGRAQLEMVQASNPHLRDEYEKRARKIASLRDAIDDREERLEEFARAINELKEKWEPRLDALVAQISRAFGESFEKIGCAGEVSVYKDEDFDQWAIQIQVKFREHEQLSILDSHRQSGGERAVSTIFYLMALQSLARAPFRVVDEINQGMDPRNERMVHERMVNIACQEHTSQYFLITPKLLHDLRYHERMRVQCIVSGEQMPKDYRDLDFRKCLEIARAVKAA